MSNLHVGAHLKASQAEALGLAGRWAVWSQAGETPGGFFLCPADETAHATGIKYVVVRAVMGRNAIEPALSLVRTDPPHPELITATTTRDKGARA